MDIGTAKPSTEELKRIPHHGINLTLVNKQYSIKDYLEYAVSTVSDIFSRGKNVLIVGGSGFYLKSFFEPVLDNIKDDPETKNKVETLFNSGGLDALIEELHKLNPNGVGVLDLNNPRRVMRALERCLNSGKTLPELQAEFQALTSPFDGYNKKLTFLYREETSLKKRVILRVKEMLSQGLVKEVKKLLDQGLLRNPSAANAIGYRETIQWLEGDEPIGQLEATIIQNTFKLLAKQRKWFRHQINPTKEINLDETIPSDLLKILF